MKEDESQDVVSWDAFGLPYSTDFNDKYFCSRNGYEESRHVSCEGNNLSARFKSLDPNVPGTFTIIETGFGTGLSFCVAWQLWDQLAPPSWTLHFISVELFPVAGADIRRALAHWPVLSSYQEKLVAVYMPQEKGTISHWLLDSGRVRLSIAYEEVVPALEQIKREGVCNEGADAWFLNGFSPFKNPLMWRQEVFDAMVPLSRAGTTLATFTVAGFVRRGLEACGFKVQRLPGYGFKNQILAGLFLA